MRSNAKPARVDAVRLGLSNDSTPELTGLVVVAVEVPEAGRQRGQCQERYSDRVSVPRGLQLLGQRA